MPHPRLRLPVFCVSLLVPAVARPQAPADAPSHEATETTEAQRGAAARALYSGRRYRAAARAYEALWRDTGAAKYRFNAGMAREAAEHYGAALLHWQAYLASDGANLEERTMLEQRLVATTAQLQRVHIHVDGALPGPATLTLGAPESAPQGPRDPIELAAQTDLDLALEAGAWNVTLQLAERPPIVARFDLTAGVASPTVTLTVPAPAIATPPPPPAIPLALTVTITPPRALARGVELQWQTVGPQTRSPAPASQPTTSERTTPTSSGSAATTEHTTPASPASAASSSQITTATNDMTVALGSGSQAVTATYEMVWGPGSGQLTIPRTTRGPITLRLPAGAYALLARAPGFAPQAIEVTLDAPRQIDLHLHRDTTKRARLGLGFGLGGAGLVLGAVGVGFIARGSGELAELRRDGALPNCETLQRCSAAANGALDVSSGLALLGSGVGAGIVAATVGARARDRALKIEAGAGVAMFVGGLIWYVAEIQGRYTLQHRARDHIAATVLGGGAGLLGSATISLVTHRLVRRRNRAHALAPALSPNSVGLTWNARF